MPLRSRRDPAQQVAPYGANRLLERRSWPGEEVCGRICEGYAVDPVPYLNSTDRGIRLAGYAALCVRAHPQLVPKIVDAALREDKPFGQFWALNALEKQLTFAPFALDSASADRLQSILGTIPHRTDRAVRVRQILQRYAKRS